LISLLDNLIPLLQQTFIQLLSSYTNNDTLVNKLWNEIEENYSGKKRHYHTLQHLQHLLTQLQAVQANINNWNTILFTLFYHDVIYHASKSDNEEKSAALAKERMREIGVEKQIVDACINQILATKSHTISTNSDTNYFTDSDLSILGQPWQVYEQYYKNVRKEYSIYPNILYKPGRKKVLQYFLQMQRIFKTNYFYQQFEIQARQNLQQEKDLL